MPPHPDTFCLLWGLLPIAFLHVWCVLFPLSQMFLHCDPLAVLLFFLKASTLQLAPFSSQLAFATAFYHLPNCRQRRAHPLPWPLPRLLPLLSLCCVSGSEVLEVTASSSSMDTERRKLLSVRRKLLIVRRQMNWHNKCKICPWEPVEAVPIWAQHISIQT